MLNYQIVKFTFVLRDRDHNRLMPYVDSIMIVIKSPQHFVPCTHVETIYQFVSIINDLCTMKMCGCISKLLTGYWVYNIQSNVAVKCFQPNSNFNVSFVFNISNVGASYSYAMNCFSLKTFNVSNATK